jgi:hypothetical protein
MTFVNLKRFDSAYHVPIALPQTELRAGRSIQIALLPLLAGQRMQIRALHLHLLRLLTPGVLPTLLNTSLGLLSVGIYQNSNSMLTGSPALVTINSPGVATLNPFSIVEFNTPGNYVALVSNNSSNIDLSIVVCGSAKLFT